MTTLTSPTSSTAEDLVSSWPERLTTARVRARTEGRDAYSTVRAWTRSCSSRGTGSLPDFLVIGTQRGGTTSLFSYLAQHPQVKAPIAKEIQYFSLHYRNGSRWYRAHFPKLATSEQTFEASPLYLYHHSAPARVAATTPDARLIVLLRNPVDRAYSHYLHNRRHGLEPLSFADALAAEDQRLAGAGLLPGARDRAHRRYSYVRRGHYDVQLERWFSHFPREQFYIVRSEDFYGRTPAVCAEIQGFLGLEPFTGATLNQLNKHAEASRESRLTPEIRASLAGGFSAHNRRLEKMLGWHSSW